MHVRGLRTHRLGMERIDHAGVRLAGEDGQTLAEYALILAFIAILLVASLTALGGAISASLGAVAGKF
jgi:Flp pilus assembly pilin Flp